MRDSKYLMCILSSSLFLQRYQSRFAIGFTMSSIQCCVNLSIQIIINNQLGYSFFHQMTIILPSSINKLTQINLIIFSLLFILMNSQKFNPYGQFPSKSNQLYEQQYEEEESQPLIQQVDDSYEPTDKEVKEYAIDTLGMRFPQDEGLLYLAREGLKAPLPDNWVPYQSRDGQVYYKHRITQEKTYDHPTDLEYRKKYQQQKEKMARKNLKSMNMKASNPLGIGPNSNNLNSNSSNLFGSKLSNSNMFAANPASSLIDSVPNAKLDPRIQEQYQEQLENYEQRLKKQWKEFDNEERQRSQNRVKLIKKEYQDEIDKIFKGKQKQIKLQDKLKEQKQKIKNKLQQKLQSNLKDQIRQYQKQLQHKNKQFVGVYEQDMQIKINKYQQEKNIQFKDREDMLNNAMQKTIKDKQNKKKQIQQTLKKLKTQFENGKNRQIQSATAEALDHQLQSIKANYAQKIKQKESQFEREYLQTKRILGFDQNAYLSQLAAKKSRIKAISQQKIESFKKKETQTFNQKSQNELDDALRTIKEDIASEASFKITEQRRNQEQRIAKQKQRMDKEFKQRVQSSIENIYDEMKTKIKAYEIEMNKKLSSVQQKFINDIYGKTKHQNKDITFRMQTKQKEMNLQNKEMMINSLKRQIQLETVTLQLMKLQSQLYKCKDQHQIDQKLIKLARHHELEYRTDAYLKYQQLYKELREKYKKDKQFLASIMNSLQNYKGGNGIGSQALLKQYNQDVRISRQNQQNLRKMESLLKRAEINDKSALEELSKSDYQYKEIELKKEMGKIGQASYGANIQQIPQEKLINRRQQTYNRTQDIETALKDHSKFLSNMRSQLNRKLYHIRSGSYY